MTVYGVPGSNACACRTYTVDGGAATGFSDVGSYHVQKAFFTTPLLSTGSHTLVVNAASSSKAIYLDYLDLVSE
jgi:hypothetical protein